MYSNDELASIYGDGDCDIEMYDFSEDEDEDTAGGFYDGSDHN